MTFTEANERALHEALCIAVQYSLAPIETTEEDRIKEAIQTYLEYMAYSGWEWKRNDDDF
jgi:hypothetical protein